jgi:hypothetical protein
MQNKFITSTHMITYSFNGIPNASYNITARLLKIAAKFEGDNVEMEEGNTGIRKNRKRKYQQISTIKVVRFTQWFVL